MAMDNKPASDLKDNRYANVEVEVVCGEEFERAYRQCCDQLFLHTRSVYGWCWWTVAGSIADDNTGHPVAPHIWVTYHGTVLLRPQHLPIRDDLKLVASQFDG